MDISFHVISLSFPIRSVIPRASSIIDKVNTVKPDLIGISATMVFNMGNVYELIRGIRKNNKRVRIIVGGYPFRTDKSLWKSVEADGFARDLKEVAEVCNRLVDRPEIIRSSQPQKKVAVMDVPVEEGERLYGKLFALNSELINAQRELSKKNIQLDK